MPRPQANELPGQQRSYIERVYADSLSEAIAQYSKQLEIFYSSLPNDKAAYRYAPQKWTLQEVLQHVVDTERILSYRLLRIARKDKTPLASFDEDSFAAAAQTHPRSFASIKEEFMAVRTATNLLIQSLNETQLSEEGTASAIPITANATGYIICNYSAH